MKRRDFITLLAAATESPLAGYGQYTSQVPRIGVLMSIAESDPEA
jgi:hypothetical protein